MSRLTLGQEILDRYSPPCRLLPTVWPPLQQDFPPLVIVLATSRHPSVSSLVCFPAVGKTPIYSQRLSPEPMGPQRT